MSLIDEALKRAQAAHQGKESSGTGARPWTPVPLPDRREARRRSAWRAAGVAALAIAIVAAAWLLRPASKAAPLAREAARPAAASAALPTPLAEAIVAPPSRGISAREARVPGAQAPAGAAAGTAAGSAAPKAPSASSPSGAPATAAKDPSAGPAPVNGHNYVGSVSLPGGAKIELGGIVFSESNATALVNGRVAGTGAIIEGFEIVRIEATRVELEGNGLKFTLSLR